MKEELLFQIFRGTSHRGSEVRVVTGEILRPLQWPRRPINVEYWKWKAHINELEARGALAALKWRTRSRAGLGQRWLKRLCLDGRNHQDRVIPHRRLGQFRDTLVTQRTLSRLL